MVADAYDVLEGAKAGEYNLIQDTIEGIQKTIASMFAFGGTVEFLEEEVSEEDEELEEESEWEN